MALRRMFSKEVVEADWFTDMPAPAQLLYIHLSMEADDDGFVTNTRMAIFNSHASVDDLSILVAKNYVIPMEDKLYLIKHWRQNNYIRNDRYTKSDFSDRLAQFATKEDGSYTFKQKADITNAVSKGDLVYQMDTTGIPNGNQWYTQDRLGKVSLGKSKSKELLADEGLSNELSLDNELRKTDGNLQPKAGAQEGVGVSASPSACEDEWWPVFKEFDYLKSEDEYRKKPYHDLLEYLSDKYGRSRVRLYLKLFVSGQEGKEINDRFNFLKKCLPSNLKEESQASKPSSGESKQSDQKPQTPSKPKLKPDEFDFEADYQARNAGRLIGDDVPHATDEEVDACMEELYKDEN